MKQKYFSEEERKAAKKAQKRKWDSEHRERKREQDRRWKTANKEERKIYNGHYYNTLDGRVNELMNRYVIVDKKANRISDKLPDNYIDREWIKKQIQKGCTYKDKCGTTDWKLIGLNRINILLPHTKDNCEPCCWECNKRIEYERKKKQVYQYTIDKVLVAIYLSVDDAADAVNGCHSNISACCHCKLKTYKGYIWSFVPL